MGHAPLKNGKYMKRRDIRMLKLYKEVIGKPTMAKLAMILVQESFCILADLFQFSTLFGQAMGDSIGMLAAASLSLFIPFASYKSFCGVADRLSSRGERERLDIAFLAATSALVLGSILIRFPLELAAESEDGIAWFLKAAVAAFPALASVLGGFEAALTIHHPELEQKVRIAELLLGVSDLKAEIAVLRGNDPSEIRQHLKQIYRGAYCVVDGMANQMVAELVAALVARHGLVVHDHFAKLQSAPSAGTGRYDSRPPEFAVTNTSLTSIGEGTTALELDVSQDNAPAHNALPAREEALFEKND